MHRRIAAAIAVAAIWISIAVSADERTEVPPVDKQKLAEKEITGLFRAEYAKAKSPAGKLALAEKLLSLGSDTKDDAVSRYVLLREARDQSAEAASLDVAFKAIDEL